MNIGVLYNSPHFTTSATTSSKHNHVKEFPNRSFSFLFMIYMNIIEREGGGGKTCMCKSLTPLRHDGGGAWW